MALLKGMTTYVAAQRELSSAYDSDLEVCHERQQGSPLPVQAQSRSPRHREKFAATRSQWFVDNRIYIRWSIFSRPLARIRTSYMRSNCKVQLKVLVMSSQTNIQGHCPACDLLLVRRLCTWTNEVDVIVIRTLGSGNRGVECDISLP